MQFHFQQNILLTYLTPGEIYLNKMSLLSKQHAYLGR